MTPDARLLQALRASHVHLPAGELAELCAMPRGAITERIAALREAGFEIDEKPGLGFRLTAAPDRIIADDLFSRLGECALVREVIVYEETDSTNDRAMRLGSDGVAGGAAVFAERQTAGRGRLGRRWSSASHLGLWFSLLLRPVLPLSMWPRLTTWAAVALAGAIEQSLGLRAEIKWPNDVCLRGQKVAGILIETGGDESGGAFAVVGIGVNVNHTREDFPPELRERATSLRLGSGRMVERGAFAAALLRELDARAVALLVDFPRLVAEASARSLLLGRWIQVRAGIDVVEGRAEALDEHGQLVLRDAGGRLLPLGAGEVTVVAM